MLGFHLPRWFASRSQSEDEQDQNSNLPWPVTNSPATSYSTPRSSRIAKISAPIPRSTATSLTGFDNPYLAATPPGSSNSLSHYRQQSSSLTRLASSSQSSVDVYGADLPKPRLLLPDDSLGRKVEAPPPAVIRVETVTAKPRASPVRRTVSSPPMSPYHPSPTDSLESAEITPTAFAAPPIPSHGGRWNLKLHTDHAGSRSTNTLPYRPRTAEQVPTMNTDVYGYSYGYPLVKQLSPIAEQDYASPDTLQRTRSLPATASDKDLKASASASPSGSQTSEIARPSPSYSSPFISRPLNRTGSQNSSRTHLSTSSTTIAKHPSKPVVPLLDIRPTLLASSPGHPSPTVSTPRSRRFNGSMPTIMGSTEDYNEEDYDYTATNESLHAESFVTATSQERRPQTVTSIREVATTVTDPDTSATVYGANVGRNGSLPSQKPSASESFITRRWDRDAGLGTGVPTFRAKKQYLSVTPAFWTFWLGFICPVLWLIGGWHFTHFGEQPPRLTFWEFYFNAGYWKEMCCGKRNKKRESGDSKQVGKQAEHRLPRWVTENQDRLYDPKRSLKGISFGYPFIPRPVVVNKPKTTWNRVVTRMGNVISKPNRLFDQLYGVKLREVRGRPESGRRCFDPWIQRCRYALCYAVFFFALGLCAASTWLIVYNTRQLA